MTKQELSNQKRRDKAVKESSMTLKAQLNAVNTDAGYKLKATDKDGNVTEYAETKREYIETSLGMRPHYSKKNVCLGYTPATFDGAVVPELKEIGTDGRTKAYKVYVDRVVTVTMGSDANGLKDHSLYTSEEADKKVKGESAQACKLYRKATIGEFGWGPGLIVKVLRQSRSITDEIARAEASAKKFEEQKAAGLYIVENRDGKLVKIAVKLDDVNA